MQALIYQTARHHTTIGTHLWNSWHHTTMLPLYTKLSQ